MNKSAISGMFLEFLLFKNIKQLMKNAGWIERIVSVIFFPVLYLFAFLGYITALLFIEED